MSTKQRRPRNDYRALAQLAPKLMNLPQTPESIRMNLGDGDSRVPYHTRLYDMNGTPYTRFTTYSHYLYESPPPEVFGYDNWSDFAYHVQNEVIYRSEEWCKVHDMFMTPSYAANVLGLGHMSMEHAWYESCNPIATRAPKVFKVEFMMARGFELEHILRTAYLASIGGPVEIVESGSVIHPTEKWFMFTPDGRVRNKIDGRFVRAIELKAPELRKAFLVVPADYMVQLQLTMWGLGDREIDFVSANISNETPTNSEMIVIRVKFNQRYVDAILPALKSFCRSVVTRSCPVKFNVESLPHVESEIVLRVRDVLALVPNGLSEFHEAIKRASESARQVLAKDFASKPKNLDAILAPHTTDDAF